MDFLFSRALIYGVVKSEVTRVEPAATPGSISGVRAPPPPAPPAALLDLTYNFSFIGTENLYNFVSFKFSVFYYRNLLHRTLVLECLLK